MTGGAPFPDTAREQGNPAFINIYLGGTTSITPARFSQTKSECGKEQRKNKKIK